LSVKEGPRVTDITRDHEEYAIRPLVPSIRNIGMKISQLTKYEQLVKIKA
jgi:hypothetical protein